MADVRQIADGRQPGRRDRDFGLVYIDRAPYDRAACQRPVHSQTPRDLGGVELGVRQCDIEIGCKTCVERG